MDLVNNLVMPLISEEATGIRQQGDLALWNNGEKISEKQAKRFIKKGQEIAVPNAGAGSYRKVFEMLGFNKVKELMTCSSAGDWSFGVKDETGWRLAFQENRYPYYGFKFSISFELWGFATFEDLVKEVEMF